MFDWINWATVGTSFVAGYLVSYIPTLKKGINWTVNKIFSVISLLWKNRFVKRKGIVRRLKRNKLTISDTEYMFEHHDKFSKEQMEKVSEMQKKAMNSVAVTDVSTTAAGRLLKKALTNLKIKNES